jgi:hypothetical protein
LFGWSSKVARRINSLCNEARCDRQSARHQWRAEVRRYDSQVKGNVKGAQLKLAATNSSAESKAATE